MDNSRAKFDLNWKPRYDLARLIDAAWTHWRAPAIPEKCGTRLNDLERPSCVRPGYPPPAKMVVASAAVGLLTSTLVFGRNAQKAVFG